MDKETLSHLLRPVRLPADPRVLVGTATSDDAGVVALTPELAPGVDEAPLDPRA